MIVAHNLLGQNAMRQFNIVDRSKRKSAEKLSSGYKINRAADDAAGLAISEKMRRQIRGLTQASLNCQDGISYVQTAEGALNEVHDMLQRMNELSVKASNATLSSDDRDYIDAEFQQIKDEIDRVFETTTFNERLIWDTNCDDRRQIGTAREQAARISTTSSSYQITNEKAGAFPTNNIRVNASDAGIYFNWTGFNGNNYTTDTISWADFEARNFSVNLSDLYNDPSFYCPDGTTPLLDTSFTIRPTEGATYTDIANTINGTSITATATPTLSLSFEDSTGNSASNPFFTSGSVSLSYRAAYDSLANGGAYGYDFEVGLDEVFMPDPSAGNLISYPASTTVESARSDTTPITFSFNMAGLGNVTSTMTGINYSNSDRDEASEGVWWTWITRSNGTRYQSSITHSVSPNLSGIMDMLTGDLSSSTPGALTTENGGCSDSGASVSFRFNLQNGGTSIGSMTLMTTISPGDTEQSVLERINEGLTSATILDFYTSGALLINGRLRNPTERTNIIDVPVYQATNKLQIQAGSEAGQFIDIIYDSLNSFSLGIANSATDTVSEAQDSINDVKGALDIISRQRSDFGAYQNRMEHTIKNLDNVVENTTDAESEIRDTDMAEEMVRYSLQNILAQAGVSVMAQANQSNDLVLSLIQ